MDNLEKLIQEMNDRIKVIDGELALLKQKEEDDKDKIKLGIISILNDGNLHLELLMDKKWFDKQEMKNLSEAVGDIQKVLLNVQNKIEKENE